MALAIRIFANMSVLTATNEELSQSKARVVICWVSLAGFMLMGWFKGLHGWEFMGQGLVTILSYLTFATLWYAIVRHSPDRYPWRRNISLIADLAIMTAWFHLGGGEVATYYPIFLWVIIGNGIRFGESYLQRGIVLGALGFGSVLYFNPYWRNNLNVGLGLMLGVVVLPVFYQGALRRLRKLNELQMELVKSRLAEKAKNRFLATMNHELRTPMNGVLGIAEALARTNLDDDQRDQLGIITSSVNGLQQTVSDILDYAGLSIDTLTLQEEDFDLHQLLGEVVTLLEPSVVQQNVSLQYAYPQGARRRFRGDPKRVRQIVFHLLSNGLKFTEQGSVQLNCLVHEEGDDLRVELAVVDTGIGMAPERREALFEIFEQGDNSTTRKYEGLGLGLGLIKQLTDMMHGSLSAESKEGEGSTFSVSLPLKKCCDSGEALAGERIQVGELGLQALVVEDNKFNQIVLKKLLGLMHINTVMANNGLEALEFIKCEKFDLVFMDIRMPIMNGYEATLKIRSQESVDEHVPIIAVTADATRQVEQRCEEVGMDAFLAKPLTVAGLEETIVEVLSVNSEGTGNQVPILTVT